MNDDEFTPARDVVVWWLMLFFVLIAALVWLSSAASGTWASGWLGAFSVLVPSLGTVCLRSVHGRWLTPSSVFLVLLGLFSFGQIWAGLLEVGQAQVRGYIELDRAFSSAVVARATYVSLVFMLCVLLGNVLPLLMPRRISDGATVRAGRKGRARLHEAVAGRVWFVLLVLLGPLVLVGDIERARAVASLGYGEGYKYQSGVLQIAAEVFPMAVVGVLVVSRRRAGFSRLVLAVGLIRNLFVMLAVQNRGEAVVATLVYLMVWMQGKAIERWKSSLVVLLSAAVGLVLLPYISYSRSISGGHGFVWFVSGLHGVSLFLTEFGGTLATLAYGVAAGGAAAGSASSYLANIFLGWVPLLARVVRGQVAAPVTAESLNSFFHRTGLGGSLVADVYLNVGFGLTFGIIAIGVGVCLCLLTRKLVRTGGSDLTRVFLWFVFSGFMTSIRGYASDIVTSVKLGLVIVAISMLVSALVRRRGEDLSACGKIPEREMDRLEPGGRVAGDCGAASATRKRMTRD